jgi:hypothetical protein
MDEFKATKKVIEENFKKIMRGQLVPVKGPSRKKSLNDPDPDMQDINGMEFEHKIKNESMMFANDTIAFNNMMMPFDQFMQQHQSQFHNP